MMSILIELDKIIHCKLNCRDENGDMAKKNEQNVRNWVICTIGMKHERVTNPH